MRIALGNISKPDSRLRIGVALSSLEVPAWVRRILQAIMDADFMGLDAVVVARGAAGGAKGRLGQNLYAWYESEDYRKIKGDPDAFQQVDVRQLLAGVPILEVPAAELESHRLDVLLQLGSGPLPHDLASGIRYGVWSLRHGRREGGPEWFEEMCQRRPWVETALEAAFVKPESRRVIGRTVSGVNFYSLQLTRNPAFWKAADLVVRTLAQLHRGGFDSLGSAATEALPRPGAADPGPRAVEMLGFLARWYRYRLEQKLLPARAEHWVLGIRNRRHTGTRPFADLDGFRVIAPPEDRFYADPFLFDKDGKTYLFFEDYPYAGRKGLISATTLSPDGACEYRPEVVLERPYHLSYPFLFDWQGVTYMMPETGDNGTVELYRAADFPRGWALDRVLLKEGNARDATLLEHNGKWWMFVTFAVPGGPSSDEVSLYCADSPLGPWTAHPRNPIVSDVRSARPAGHIMHHGGELIRPGQDSSYCYGYAITLNRIERLTETEYKETPIGRVEPTWSPGLAGTHTVNMNDRFEVIDGKLLLTQRGRARLAQRHGAIV